MKHVSSLQLTYAMDTNEVVKSIWWNQYNRTWTANEHLYDEYVNTRLPANGVDEKFVTRFILDDENKFSIAWDGKHIAEVGPNKFILCDVSPHYPTGIFFLEFNKAKFT